MTNPNQERSREKNLSPRIWSRDPRSLSIRGNKIPRRATKFILSCWIFARASNHFSREKEGRGGGGRGGGSVCKSCQTLQRRTEQRQRVHPISRLGRKNFHYSLIPSSPPPPHLIVAPFTPSSPILYAVAPRRTLEDRYVKKKVRILFPEMLLPRKPFLLTLLPPPSISHHRRVSKLQEGGGGVLVDSLCGCGITRGHGWQTRLVRILFPKCGEDRFSSPRGWAATSGGNGNEGMMPCKPSPPPPPVHHPLRAGLVWLIECVLLHPPKRMGGYEYDSRFSEAWVKIISSFFRGCCIL